eukprot:gene20904-22954_t
MARQNIVKSQASMKKYYDQRATDPDFTVGDKVWVYTPKVPKGLTKKLEHLWHGPYRISQQLSAVHFKLSTFDNRRVTTKVHANRLKLFYDRATRPIGIITNDVLDEYLSPEDMPTDSFDDSTNGHVPEEPTEHVIPEETPIINDDMYTVERILDSRKRGGKIQYLIKWSGYPSSANTWEPEENVLDKALLERFHEAKLRQRAPRIAAFTTGPKCGQVVPHLSPLLDFVQFGLLLLMLAVVPLYSMEPNIGPLYDCSRVTPDGVYHLNHRTSCLHTMHNSVQPLKHMFATVSEPVVHRTKITIKLCSAYKAESPATTFLKTAKPSIHTDLLEAHITAALEAQRATMISSWDQLCKQQTEFDHFRRWAVATFPDSASRLLASEYGLHVRLVGEAIMVSRCTPINMYTVHWSRQYNTTCYNLFPVIIPRNSSLLFVDFSTRQLKPYSNVISCQSRPEFTVVEDLAGSLWHILANGTLFRSVASDTLYPHPSFRLPKLRGFNSKLVQPQSVSLDRLSLLDIVTNNYGTFQEIRQFADNNGGDFFTGLGQVLGRTISALGTGGSKLLDAAGRSVNTALHGIGDAGVKVATGMTQSAGSLIEKGGHAIRDVEHGTASLFHSIFGSIGGAILWGVVVLVIAYLLYSRFASHCTTCGQRASPQGSSNIELHELPPCERCIEDSNV